MKMPNPKATTTTEAYLAYKAGVIAEAELKPKLYHPYIHLDGWLAYWCGLVDTYPTDKNGDPECLTDEEAYIAYLANVTNAYPLNLKDPADPRVAGYLRYLIAAKFGRPNYPVTREELYLSIMKPPVVPSGDPSSSIELEGTVEAPFISLEAYGDTSQQTYSGKNLFNLTKWHDNAKRNNVTNTGMNSEGGFWFTSNAGADAFLGWTYNSGTIVNSQDRACLFPAKPSTNYTISCKGATLGNSSYVCFTDSSYNVLNTSYIGLSNAYSASFTTPANTAYILLRLGNLSSSAQRYEYKYIQLEEGRDATSYEPYVGGVASPSPDYPQEVKTVTGRQLVAVTDGNDESADYELNLGKNLLKLSEVQSGVSENGVSYTITDSKIILDGTTTGAGNVIATTPLGVGLYAGNYMYSIRKVGGSFTVPVVGQDDAALYISDENGNRLAENSMYGVNSGGYRESQITVSSNKELSIQLFANRAGIKFDNFELELQLEKGTVATSYAPYFEPIELCKIGDFQDYIYRDLAGNWKIHKEISSYTFTGQEGWTKHPNGSFYSSNNLYGSLGGSLPSSNTDVAAVISDAFITSTYSSFDHSSAGQICINSDGTNNPRIAASGYNSSTNTFTGMLASKRPKLYYPLAEATDEELTNEELIAQLDALMEGGSYEGTTYITVSSEDLPALLKVEAAKDV
jgi:hypothetical protein